MVRLGDGTEESRARVIAGLEWMWRFVDELFEVDADDEIADRAASPPMCAGCGRMGCAHRESAGRSDAGDTQAAPRARWAAAAAIIPNISGHLLSEMQFLPRAYPGA